MYDIHNVVERIKNTSYEFYNEKERQKVNLCEKIHCSWRVCFC